MRLREAPEGQHGFGVVHDLGELRDLRRIYSDGAPLITRGLGRLLGEGRGDEGGDERAGLLPAWASALRRKWTLPRCQVAGSTLLAAAFMPSCASETTSLTPRRPRRVNVRRNSSRSARPPTGRSPCRELAPPSVLTATAILRRGTMRPGGVPSDRSHQSKVRPVALDRPGEEGPDLSSISSHSRLTWLFLTPLIPIDLTSRGPNGSRSLGYRLPGSRPRAPSPLSAGARGIGEVAALAELGDLQLDCACARTEWRSR